VWRRLAPFALVALAAAGCAESPTVPVVRPAPSPRFVLPESTLATLERSVENRLTNDYALCFTDSLGDNEPGFYASFDPSDLADWLQNNPPPGTWDLQRELRFLPRFLAYNTSAFYEVTFDTLRPDFDIPPDVKVLNRTYRVFAAGSPVAAGAAVLTFQRVSGEWKIRFWEDLRDTAGVRTWGTARLHGQG
jgi:hypothetical protein